MTNEERYPDMDERLKAFREWDRNEGTPYRDTHTRFERIRLWMESEAKPEKF